MEYKKKSLANLDIKKDQTTFTCQKRKFIKQKKLLLKFQKKLIHKEIILKFVNKTLIDFYTINLKNLNFVFSEFKPNLINI